MGHPTAKGKEQRTRALNGLSYAYVPFFPLGGLTPLQSSKLDAAAASLQSTPMQVALAWLLQLSPNIVLIPGTSSVKHLRENLEAATLRLPSELVADLNSIGDNTKRDTSVPESSRVSKMTRLIVWIVPWRLQLYG